MLTAKELVWLQDLQLNLAIRRDWVAVAHLQCLMDRIVDEHPVLASDSNPAGHGAVLH